MGAMLKDKIAGEDMLRQSELDWTIVYASILSDGAASGSVVVLPDSTKRGLSQRISRTDLAAWLVDVATGAQYIRRNGGITGGTAARERRIPKCQTA